MSGKPTLISVPVGNNPARIRLLIYLKGLEDQIDLKTPADYGGLDSEEYRKLNPQGKIPVLILPGGAAIFEARVISGYVCDRWEDVGPSLRAATPEARALAALVNQIHDLYIASPNSSNPQVTATQGCMYKGVDLIDAPTRAAKVAEIAKQLDVLEGLILAPYCAGEVITEADLALYPTFQFFEFLLPKVFGWTGVFHGRPKLQAWLAKMDELPAAARVKAEMAGALAGWETSGRLNPIIEQVKSAPDLKWVFP